MAEAENPFEKAAAGYHRPCLRRDLRIVYESPATGKGQVRIIDPRGGRQFTFNEREHALCRAADGTADLAAIHAHLVAETGAEMTASEVMEFFRRLQIMGLLEPEPTEPATSRPARAAGLRLYRREESGARTSPATDPGPVSERASELGTRGRRAPAAASGATGRASRFAAGAAANRSRQPQAKRPVLAPPPGSEAINAEPLRPESLRPEPTGPAILGPAIPPVASPDATQTPPPEATPPKAAPPESTPPETDPGMVLHLRDPHFETPHDAVALPTPAETAEPPRRKTAAEVPAFNFFDEEFGDFGGMRGGAGGMGGMRGGMGGGMRGGGMGGGGMGGMRGGMGGGMRGVRGRNVEPKSAGRKKFAQLPLFNPEPLLRLLYVLFYPLKWILWVIAPLTVIAGLSLLNNLAAVGVTLSAVTQDFSSISQFLIGFFIVNLLTCLAQGVAIVANGGRVKKLGLTLVFGFLPRFFIDKSGIAEMDRSGQLWGYGASLLTRLALFGIGTLIWAITRERGGILPPLALITAQFGLVHFILSAWPLMPGDGIRWISALFNEPKLTAKAWIAFKHVFLGGKMPPMIERRDALPLALFAVGIALNAVALVLVIGISALIWFQAEMGGLGVVIFLGFMGSFLLWLLAIWATVSARTGGGGAGANFDATAFRQMAAERGMADALPDAADEDDAQSLLSGRAKVIWGLLCVGLLVVAFRPYSYEAGGQVEILPLTRAQAVARSDGEILDILVQDGDIVAKGQVLAQLSSWDQESAVATSVATLAGAEASLARLQAGPKPEEVELARRKFESAQTSVDFSRTEAERSKTLVATGVVSQQTYEKNNTTYQSDLAELEVARANLELVQSGATAEEIQVAQAEVDRQRQELRFRRDEMERSRITAPMAGRVVTQDLDLRHGSFLKSGETLLEIEPVGVVNAVISVPESDIALIRLGGAVRLKVWGESGEEILGEVQSIATVAENESYGRVVRVTAGFDNQDGLLRSGTSGYAKIEGAEMRVWEAYLRSIMRFFQIEFWSWIP